MSRLLVYVMTSDTGKAPRVEEKKCILKGCKKRTIEKNAKKDDWIIGIGGKTLSEICKREYDRKLIYAMKVNDENPPKSGDFAHYGDKAISLNKLKNLQKIINSTRFRTKYITDPNLYQDFVKFMDKQPRGKIGYYCCGDNGDCRRKSCRNICP